MLAHLKMGTTFKDPITPLNLENEIGNTFWPIVSVKRADKMPENHVCFFIFGLLFDDQTQLHEVTARCTATITLEKFHQYTNSNNMTVLHPSEVKNSSCINPLKSFKNGSI